MKATDAPSERSVRDLLARHPRVLVIGDLILDCWFSGTSERMTREAPVPVVEVSERVFAAGGAANTALNLAALGAEVRLVGVIGTDDEGTRLSSILQSSGLDVSYLVRSPDIFTTSKTRILAGEQLIVRVDTASDSGYPVDVLDSVVEALRLASASPDATAPEDGGWASAHVVCDYAVGALTGVVHDELVACRRSLPLWVLDAHRVGDWSDLRPDIVTPNAAEASLLLGLALKAHGDRAAVVAEHAAEILAMSGAAGAVVTLDRDGSVVLDGLAVPRRTVARPAQERHASGAGDTFTAALTLARAGGWSLQQSAHLAQAAANVVVRHDGTTLCTSGELLEELRPGLVSLSPEKNLGHAQLFARLDAERAVGRRIVFTNGCFDLLHRGHTTYLQQARQLGDVLVVAVNSDQSARRLKGPGRPINPAADRAAVLVALEFVDYVTVFDEDTPIGLIERIRPDLYAKGGDYSADMLAETAAVERCGGVVQILGYVSDHSTTQVVDRIRDPLY